MEDEKRYVLLGPNSSFVGRALAVTLSSSSPTVTTVIEEGKPLPPTTNDYKFAAQVRMPKIGLSDSAIQEFVVRRPDSSPAPSPSPRSGAGGPTITVDPTFKLIFLTATGLTILASLLAVSLGIFGPENHRVDDLISAFSTLAKIGFGSIIGLIGGKTAGTAFEGKKLQDH